MLALLSLLFPEDLSRPLQLPMFRNLLNISMKVLLVISASPAPALIYPEPKQFFFPGVYSSNIFKFCKHTFSSANNPNSSGLHWQDQLLTP